MAFNKDLKLKAPIFEDYGSSLQEAFNRGKYQTTEHYRAKLFMYKQQHDALIKKHAEELEVSKIEGKLELIDELFNESVLSEEKEKLESELVLAVAKASDVKVPTIDWFKLNEPQMYD
ncbi:hypothetical protein Bca4012_037445 [Brassica carinata]